MIADIEKLKERVFELCRIRGHDAADAMMMLLIAGCQTYREFAKEPEDAGAIHEAIDKAFEAASNWWVPDDEEGTTLQ